MTPASVVAGLVVLVALATIMPTASDGRLPGFRTLAPLSMSCQREVATVAPLPQPRFGTGGTDAAPPTSSVGVRAAAAWRTLDLPPPARA